MHPSEMPSTADDVEGIAAAVISMETDIKIIRVQVEFLQRTNRLLWGANLCTTVLALIPIVMFGVALWRLA